MTMKKARILALAIAVFSVSQAMAGGKEKGIKGMSVEKQIKLAQSAAPLGVSRDATVMIAGEDGNLMEAKKGTNGFVCLPDIDGQEVPDPVCLDQAAYQWVMDLMANKPKPTNTAPGIAYMARGGWHWEKDGKIVMDKNEKGAKRVGEPPHWMILWPFDPKASGLPSRPEKFGTYVMFEGTPYAHLMIYQNPNKLK